MSTAILATKLYVPRLQPRVVLRSRLVARLDEGLQHGLTLISAPAGFGKTTLLGEWLAAVPRPVAWFSLDEGDSDPARFLAYLIAALRTVAADIGEDVLGALESPQPPPAGALLTALLKMNLNRNGCGIMPNRIDSKGDSGEPVVYQIRLRGHLDRRWTDWFEGLTITHEDDGATLLSGPVADQAALHSLLRRVRDLGIPLISVVRSEIGGQTCPDRKR